MEVITSYSWFFAYFFIEILKTRYLLPINAIILPMYRIFTPDIIDMWWNAWWDACNFTYRCTRTTCLARACLWSAKASSSSWAVVLESRWLLSVGWFRFHCHQHPRTDARPSVSPCQNHIPMPTRWTPIFW